MFGYIRPHKPELKIKEFDVYKSVYCSLCKQMGKSFGVLSRLTLSYDCTFLAIIGLSIKENCPGFKNGSCVVNPFKKCRFCLNGEEQFEFSAAVSVIMSYHKIKDDINDSNYFGKIKAYSMLCLVLRGYKKAKNLYPKIDEIVSNAMKMQDSVENNNNGIDEAAEPTAYMLSGVLELLSEDEKQKRVLNSFGYYIGRWVYIIDAADDIEKDIKENNFNPFINEITNKDNPKINEYCNEVLNQTLSQAINAYGLLKINYFDDIIKNIIMLGLPMMQKKVLFDKGGEK